MEFGRSALPPGCKQDRPKVVGEYTAAPGKTAETLEGARRWRIKGNLSLEYTGDAKGVMAS